MNPSRTPFERSEKQCVVDNGNLLCTQKCCAKLLQVSIPILKFCLLLSKVFDISIGTLLLRKAFDG